MPDPSRTTNGLLHNHGQSALVTGASSGIGRAIALAFLDKGMHVYLVGRDVAKLERVAAHDPANTTIVAADLATQEGIALVGAAASRLDVLVSAAGQFLHSPTALISRDRWAALDAVNLYAPILLAVTCLAQLKASSGQIVFINSSAIHTARPGLAAYAAGKCGLQAAVNVLRQEVNSDGIRVLSVFPGRTDTPMQRAVLESEGRSAPPGSMMMPEDVAAMVLAAINLPRSAEVTEVAMRPMHPL